jgi:hypothetical protein
MSRGAYATESIHQFTAHQQVNCQNDSAGGTFGGLQGSWTEQGIRIELCIPLVGRQRSYSGKIVRSMHPQQLLLSDFRRIEMPQEIEKVGRYKSVLDTGQAAGIFRMPCTRVMCKALRMTNESCTQN